MIFIFVFSKQMDSFFFIRIYLLKRFTYEPVTSSSLGYLRQRRHVVIIYSTAFIKTPSRLGPETLTCSTSFNNNTRHFNCTWILMSKYESVHGSESVNWFLCSKTRRFTKQTLTLRPNVHTAYAASFNHQPNVTGYNQVPQGRLAGNNCMFKRIAAASEERQKTSNHFT